MGYSIWMNAAVWCFNDANNTRILMSAYNKCNSKGLEKFLRKLNGSIVLVHFVLCLEIKPLNKHQIMSLQEHSRLNFLLFINIVWWKLTKTTFFNGFDYHSKKSWLFAFSIRATTLAYNLTCSIEFKTLLTVLLPLMLYNFLLCSSILEIFFHLNFKGAFIFNAFVPYRYPLLPFLSLYLFQFLCECFFYSKPKNTYIA